MADVQVREFPNPLKDETGAVMVEFIICAPFLMAMMVSIFFFTDINRFTCSASALSSVQTWRSAGKGETGLNDSDQFSFAAPGGVSIPGGVSSVLSYANVRNAMIVAPPLLTAATDFGGLAAAGIYTIPGAPYQIQGMPVDNFNKEAFSPSKVGYTGGPNDVAYKNISYLQPMLAAMNDFVGKREDGADDGVNAVWNLSDIHIVGRQSIMNDPYSVSWGDPSSQAAKRMRNVDRFTIIRAPNYFAMCLIHTAIAGGVGVFADLPQIIEDIGYIPAGSGVDSSTLSGLSSISSALSFLEQSQPLRKVDKRVDKDHDEDGDTDWGYHTWGWGAIGGGSQATPDDCHIKASDNTWEQVQ